MRRAAGLFLALALSACGGTPNTPNGPTVGTGGPIPPPVQLVNAQVTVAIPLPSKRGHGTAPNYLSQNTRSLTVSLASVNGAGVSGISATTINTYSSAPGCKVSGASIVCTALAQGASGDDVFNVTTYAGPNATGALLSAGTIAKRIASGGGALLINTKLALSVGGVVAKLALSVAPASVPRGKPADVNVTLDAFDATGAQIIGPTSFDVPLSLSIQGDSVSAFKLRNGSVAGSAIQIPRPPQKLILAYDGNTQAANVTVQASVPNTTTSASAPFSVQGQPPPPPVGAVYVLNAGHDGGKGATVTVYDGKASGNVAPVHTLQLSSSLYARSIAIDASGNLYVGYLDNLLGFSPATGTPDTGNEIAIFAPGASGSATPKAVITSDKATQSALYPMAIAFDPAGDAITYGATAVGGNAQNAVLAYAPNSSGGVAPASAWAFASPQLTYSGPTGLALDAGGNFYVNGALKTSLGPNYGVFANAVANAKNPSATPSRTIPWDTKTQLAAGTVGNVAVDASGEIFVANFALQQSGTSTACQGLVNVYAGGSSGGTTDVAPLRTLHLNGVTTTNSACFAPNNPLAGYYPSIVAYGASVFVADEFGNAVDEFPSGGNGNVSPSKQISGSATQLDVPIGVVVITQAPGAQDAATSGPAQVRFVEGAPQLQTNVGGVPLGLGTSYLSVDGTTIASSFGYGTITQYLPYQPGKHELTVRDSLGYEVGPFTVPEITAAQSYSVVLIGTYPKYTLLAFADPKTTSGASLAVYEASPSLRSLDFGTYRASTQSLFHKLGSVRLGSVGFASLGSKVTNFGAYAGKGTTPMTGGTVTLRSIDSFDTSNSLPFHAVSRASLFVLDPQAGSTFGPIFGIFDR